MAPPPRSGLSPANRSNDFCGRQVVWLGLVGSLAGLLLGLFLRTIVERTPAQLPSDALDWLILTLAVMGGLGAMAVEAVRQLQVSNPHPAYHRLLQQRQRLARERQGRRRANPE